MAVRSGADILILHTALPLTYCEANAWIAAAWFAQVYSFGGYMAEGASDQAQKTESTPMLTNPVFLTALFGAIIAAFANAYVALMNNNTLVDVETHKENEEQFIEAKKAEFSRLLEVSKLDVNLAKTKIRAFCEMNMIKDIDVCSRNVASENGTPASQNVPPSIPNSPATYSEDVIVTWDSPVESGGHSQQEECNNGISELQKDSRYKGKTISVTSSSENSNKDFLGHVTYRYHCLYRVTAP